MPKFFGYYEKILQKNGKAAPYLLGKKICYADLSLFQMVEGLRYAFPHTMAKIEPTIPRPIALHDHVAARPWLKKYLAHRAAWRSIPTGSSATIPSSTKVRITTTIYRRDSASSRNGIRRDLEGFDNRDTDGRFGNISDGARRGFDEIDNRSI